MKQTRIFTYSILTLFFLATGCFEEQKNLTKTWVAFEDASVEHAENDGDPVEVTVSYSGKLRTSDIEVTYTVSSTDAIEGADYILPANSGSVTIPAGEASVTFVAIEELIDNGVLEGDKTIILTLESAGDLTVGFPGPDGIKKSTTITVVDDDCAIPSLAGTYHVVNRNASPAPCGDPGNDDVLTYTATITVVSDDGGGKFTYNISDITGGLYALCYEDGENPGDIETDGFAITLTDQPDVVYGGDIFNGTGQIECSGNFTLSWSNGFGDKGTSLYTKLN